MRVCETRNRASYRSVAACSAAFRSMLLIPISGSDLTTFHACLSARERKTTLVSTRAVNKIHPGGRTRHSSAKGSPPERFRKPETPESVPGKRIDILKI